ncbi:MAG TPA: hypothetical protein VHH36_09950 [Candidatus Thermoplasmatota archaeon]|nr:hypothetical protein [Candidatus Thermoplasmatota archaeon]
MPGACARCGSTLLHHVPHPDGEFAYEEATSECLHCGHLGEPKQFRSTQALEEFRMAVRGPP